MRRFGQNDWMGFMGCQRFSDGSDPVISDFDGYCLIVEALGAHIVTGNAEFYFDREFTAEQAEAYATEFEAARASESTPDGSFSLPEGFKRI